MEKFDWLGIAVILLSLGLLANNTVGWGLFAMFVGVLIVCRPLNMDKY